MKTTQKGYDEASQICSILNSQQRLLAFKLAMESPKTLSDILGDKKDDASLKESIRIALFDLCELGILSKERPQQTGEVIWHSNPQTQDYAEDFLFCAEAFDQDLKDLSNTTHTAQMFEQLANITPLFKEPERLEIFKLIYQKRVSNIRQAQALQKNLSHTKVLRFVNEFVESGMLVSRKTKDNSKYFEIHPKIEDNAVSFFLSVCKLGQHIAILKQKELKF